MRAIVRCVILAPALAFGLPAGHAGDQPKENSVSATPPKKDPPKPATFAQAAKPIPPFLAKTKPAPLPASPASSATTGTGSAGEGASRPATNPEFSSSIRRSFPYAPSAEPATEEAQADATLPVVEMKPFHVATSRIVERATKGMEERRQQEREKAFKLKDGGRFGKIGPAEIGLKFDPKHKGWDILSIPW